MTLLYTGDWPARILRHVPHMNRVALREHALPILPPSPADQPRRPLRVAFVSDLHLGPLTSPLLLDRVFHLVRGLAPDVLLLGGDYVSFHINEKLADELAARLASVDVPLKLAVLGNHDLWTDHARVEDALQQGGARVLFNEAVRLPAPHGDVAIVGLDDPWVGDIDADRAFASAGDAALKVALVHAPEGYPHVRGRGAALMVCGHTHGGQIALPRGPVVVHGPYGRRFPAGLYQMPDLQLYVSRGIGNVDVPLRAYAVPDLALFTLHAADAPA